MTVSVNDKDFYLYDCISFFDRLKGFMFEKNINYCKRFKKCNSIHTFFMLDSIDVVMTDKNNNVLYIFKNLKPNRIILPKKNVYYTYEFPKNTIDRLNKICCL